MRYLHRTVGFLVIPLLIALLAAPVAAAPGNGTPKTVFEHPSWFHLDPVPTHTGDARITLTGKIAGNFPVTIEHAGYRYQMELKGPFEVTINLVPGENRIRFVGQNPGDRLINYEVVVQKTGDGAGGGTGGNTGGDTGGGPVGPAYQLELQLGTEPFIADGQSQITVRAVVTDLNGHLVRLDNETIQFSSSNPDVVRVLTPEVATAQGVAIATIQAGTVSSMVFITASSPNLGSVTIPVIPSP